MPLRRAVCPARESLESQRGRPLPQVPPAGLRRGRGPGGGDADAAERDRARADPAGVSLRRPARHRQDLAGANPREGAELRAGPDADARQDLPRLPRDRRRHLPRRDRDGRGLTARDRRHSRDPGARRASAGRRALQGLHPRRGASAHGRRLQRAAEADRGAPAAPRVRLLHDRPREDAPDRSLALPDVRVLAAAASRASAGAAPGGGRRGDRGAGRGALADRSGGARRVPRRRLDLGSARRRHGERGHGAGGAAAARSGRGGGAVPVVRPDRGSRYRRRADLRRGALGAGTGSRAPRDGSARAPAPSPARPAHGRGARLAAGHRGDPRAAARAGEPARRGDGAATLRPAGRGRRGHAPGRRPAPAARARARQGDPAGCGPLARVRWLSPRAAGGPPSRDVDLEQLQEAWQRTILPAVEEKSIPTASVLREAHPKDLAGDTLTVEFPRTASFHRELAEEPKNATLLAEALYEVTGRHLALAFEVGENGEAEEEPAPDEPVSEEEIIELMKGTFDAREVSDEQ